MTLTLDLPPDVVQRLQEKAAAKGQSLEAYLAAVSGDVATSKNGTVTVPDQTHDDWLDHEFHAYCAREADPSVTLEEVRRALAKIPGSMAEVISAEREER